MSTLGVTKMHVGVIMSTPGDVQYTGGVQYTRGIPSVHGGILVQIRQSHYQIWGIFVLAPFATMQMYMLAFGTSDSLLKFSVR